MTLAISAGKSCNTPLIRTSRFLSPRHGNKTRQSVSEIQFHSAEDPATRLRPALEDERKYDVPAVASWIS